MRVIFSSIAVFAAIFFSGHFLDIFNTDEFVLIDHILGWALIWTSINFYAKAVNEH